VKAFFLLKKNIYSEENPQFSKKNLGEWKAQIKSKNASVCTWKMNLQSDKTKRNIERRKRELRNLLGLRNCLLEWSVFGIVVDVKGKVNTKDREKQTTPFNNTFRTWARLVFNILLAIWKTDLRMNLSELEIFIFKRF